MNSPNMLGRVRSSRNVGPLKGLIHGHEKIGKSTFVCDAPSPIVADVENRIAHLDVPAVEVASWNDVMSLANELHGSKHDYKTFVIDSVSSLEVLLKEHIMGVEGWTPQEAEEWLRWVKLAQNTYWPQLFLKLERLIRERGMNVWMTAHTLVKNVKNPRGEDYDRNRPAIGGTQGPEKFLHWCDVVLFATWEDIVRKEGRTGKIRASTTGQRVVYTTHTPMWDAGNSYNLPDRMPLDYAAFDRARESGLRGPERILGEIRELYVLVEDKEVRAKTKAFVDKHKSQPHKLQSLVERLRTFVDEQEEARSKKTKGDG